MERLPVDFGAGGEEVGEAVENRHIAGVIIAQRLQPPDPALRQEAEEHRARPDLDRRGDVAERLGGRGKPHRRAELAHPIGRVGELVAGRRAGHGRDDRLSRRAQPGLRGDFGELVEDRLHQPAVEGVRDAQPRAHTGGKLGRERLQRVERAGDRDRRRRVGRGQLQRRVPGEPGCGLGLRHRQRHHPAARRQRLHQPAARRDQRRRVRQIHHPADTGGGIFADAVPDHHIGAHAPMPPQHRQRILDREQGRLGVAGLIEPRPPVRIGGPDEVGERHVEMRPQQGGAFVERGTENRLARMETARHARPLAALAGKQEGDPGRRVRRRCCRLSR